MSEYFAETAELAEIRGAIKVAKDEWKKSVTRRENFQCPKNSLGYKATCKIVKTQRFSTEIDDTHFLASFYYFQIIQLALVHRDHIQKYTYLPCAGY